MIGQKWIALLIAAPLFGCAGSLASVSAGHIGCAPSQIEISDEEMGFNTTSWTATCGERVYSCSGSQNQVACTPLGGEPSKPPSAAAPATAAPPTAAATPSPAPPAGTRWVTQAIEECGVQAEFPSKPKLGSEATKTKTGSYVTYSATAARGDESAMVLSCARIAELKTSKHAVNGKLLDKIRDSVLKAVAGDLVSERDVIGGREIDFSVDGKTSRARLLVFDDRVVTATVSPVSAFGKVRTAQFLRSVELKTE